MTHLVTTSFEPEYESKNLVRRYAISGDSLTLSGSTKSNEEAISFTIHWTRER